nr:biliverdin-producing heme oxygenase [Phytoactinopolyspora mesophila]
MLRDRSRGVHQRAEGASFMKALMNGEIDRGGYAQMVIQHLFIYEALEAVGRELRNNPCAGAFVTDDLVRVPHLREDLDALLEPGWRERITPLPATRRYAARIRDMAGWPAGFVAHHYTRYLGDLSGGLAIGQVVGRVYGIEGAGISFYRFDRIPRPKLFKDAYRDKLDALALDPDEQERVIQEVLTAYRLNTDVFVELSRAVELGTGL